jgi:2-ketocyclohexanecarboxyl-CoA hydrolase
MNFTEIVYEERGSVAWITINHPERHNAFDHSTIREVGQGVTFAGQNSAIGVIVLTGAGDDAFSAGGYLRDLVNFDIAQARALFGASLDTFNIIRHVPQPVIAAVNGYAIGGGNELVVACDLAIASERAKFGQTGPRVGSSPIFGGTNFLTMSIGEKKAKEVCFLCRQYSAQEALALGWINQVVAHDELYAETERWCEELLDKSPSYLEVTKVTSNIWWDMLAPAYSHAQQALLRLAGSPEMHEGASAFMEKRKPNFRQFRR